MEIDKDVINALKRYVLARTAFMEEMQEQNAVEVGASAVDLADLLVVKYYDDQVEGPTYSLDEVMEEAEGRETESPICTHDTCCCSHCGPDCGCDCQRQR